MKYIYYLLLLAPLYILSACSDKDGEGWVVSKFKVDEIIIEGKSNEPSYFDIDIRSSITLNFSEAIDATTIDENLKFKDSESGVFVPTTYLFDGVSQIVVTPVDILDTYKKYQLVVYPNMKSTSGEKIMTGRVFDMTTNIDQSDKFPRITDDALLDLVQKQTFKYFWDFGHPTSGMARERSTSGDVVTTGGTGFGVMSMIAAADRGFITRAQAAARVQQIVSFLGTCTTYHGAFSHWINGNTGATVPFSEKDTGADLVETALLFQGLLTARAYFDQAGAEATLRTDITTLWEAVEWTWFQNGKNTLYWHWKPKVNPTDNEWEMNLKVEGWNESLIVYVLAASSPTYPITKTVYDQGWARNGEMENGNDFYGINLPLGENYGGPLFLSQYSFMGINPTDLTDQYTNYWTQNLNHTLINYTHSVENPNKQAGYSASCWGLTASDGNEGYSAHSPSNDRGVIAPTAALSAMAYTPAESMEALHYFYYKLGDNIWGDYGFVDAFNHGKRWFDTEYVAIDQGATIIMIENYRSGLLWDKFMSIPEIKTGMTSLGFQSPNI